MTEKGSDPICLATDMKRSAIQPFDQAAAQMGAATQRVIKRNWKFSLVPRLALSASLLMLLWEVIRQNVGSTLLIQWPWTIQMLGVAPAAALSGIFASLILAREQFARSFRPSISWSCHLKHAKTLGGPAWTAVLMNFGPGIAYVERATYSLRLKKDLLIREAMEVPRSVAIALLAEYDLQEGRDYQLRLFTAGAPLPVVKSEQEGMQFAALKEEAISICRGLDFHLIIVDTMGDQHSKSLPFVAALPTWRGAALSRATAEIGESNSLED